MIAQYIIDNLQKQSGSKIISQLRKRFFQIIRKTYLFFYNEALINYHLENHRITLPLKHDLPVIRSSFPFYDTHLNRIPLFINKKYPDFQIIDIGANVGDSTVIIRSCVDVPVLCIEGDSMFYSLLKKNTAALKNIFYEKCFIGDFSADTSFKLVSSKGTARLVPGLGITSSITFQSIPDVISKYPFLNNIKFLKIDTDGFDCKIIRSNIGFIRNNLPVILFEYDPYLLNELKDDGLSVFTDLKDAGYENLIIYDNKGDYLLSLSLREMGILEELHIHFLDKQSAEYLDIYIFPNQDQALFDEIKKSELRFFKSFKTAVSYK